MPLYTRTGDEGDTGLFPRGRVKKDDIRIETYGTVDELNSVLGVLRSEVEDRELDGCLQRIQEWLFEVGADLATEGGNAAQPTVEAAIVQVEHWIDDSEEELAPLQSFVLPGGHRTAALLHLARTTARRAERRFWTLARSQGNVPRAIGVLINRLSDLFFSWARRANARAGRPDIPWRRDP